MSATIDRNAYASATHAALMAALLAEGGAPVAATITTEGAELRFALPGATYSLAPVAMLRRPHPTAPDSTANVYGLRYGPAAGADDVLVVADDGRVFDSIAAYDADGSPLCDLADADPRAAVVAHLAALVPA